MENDYIITKDLSVGYNNSPLIENINLHLKKGEILTIIGANGEGKSTILKSIAKQLALINGFIYMDGESIGGMREKDVARKMSVVLTAKINPELMNCFQVAAAGRYPYTGYLGILSERDKELVWEALKLVNAEELAEQDFSQISDGQRQRILLARAICQEPEIIVLDEPTSFLDIKHKLELLTILKQLVSDKNIAVIMSLHEIDLAQKISDYVVCINNKKIERYGAPEEIFTTEYIASLYDITRGSYNAALGSLEMEKNSGIPKVFVIGGNGSGINIYRKLQRKGIPFAAGILHENDVDYSVAKALASRVITEKAFEVIGDEKLREAEQVASKCEKIYCMVREFGSANRKNKELLEKMLALGIEICYDI